jgi:uncharacterized protein
MLVASDLPFEFGGQKGLHIFESLVHIGEVLKRSDAQSIWWGQSAHNLLAFTNVHRPLNAPPPKVGSEMSVFLRRWSTSTAVKLSERLQSDLVNAMRSKDQFRIDAIRSIRSKITYAAKAPGAVKDADKSDDVIVKVIRAAIGDCERTIEEVGKLGDRGAKLVDDARREVALLSGYLPTQLDDAAIRIIVLKVAETIQASGMQDMKRVYPLVMQEVGTSADGKRVSSIIKNVIGGDAKNHASTKQ